MAHVPRRKSKDPPRQGTRASPRNTRSERSQLDEWYKTDETHEQLAVGENTSRSCAKTLGFLEEIERKVDGDNKEQSTQEAENET